ncbi:Tkl protein kinase, partial [Globisporangium splendens]
MRLHPFMFAPMAAMAAASVEAATCSRSGLATPPREVTFVADSTDASSTSGVIVGTDCQETVVVANTTTIESDLQVRGQNIVHVALGRESTAVVSSDLAQHADGINEVCGCRDLTDNKMTSLSGLVLPSNLQMLVLDLNLIESASASDFPTDLRTLYMRKCGLVSLAVFDFPTKLQSLSLTGNKGLSTLNGTVLPDQLTKLSIGGSTIDKFVVLHWDGHADEGPVEPQCLRAFRFCYLSIKLTALTAKRADTMSFIRRLCPSPDAAFDAAYPVRAAVPKASSGGSTSSSSTTTTTNMTPSPSAGASETTPSGGSSHTTMYLTLGILVGLAVVVGGLVTWLIHRRKNRGKKLGVSGLQALLTETNKDSSETVSADVYSMNSAPPVSNSNSTGGFFANDVRNDEELLPYRLPREDLEIVRELATGGFGIVYLAHFYDQLVVMKQIAPKKAASNTVLLDFMAEIRLYARLEHPKVVRFIGLSWTTLFDLALIVEYMPNGDLDTLLKTNRALRNGREVFTWFSDDAQPRSKALIALDIAEALVYLHSFDPVIIHRDLKSKNVLMSEEWAAKLTDFGVSREASENTMTGGMGTGAWIAPEVLQGGRYSEKADIYSFGILLSELDTCGHPYNSNRSEADALTDAKIALLVSTNAIKPTMEPDCPASIRSVILSCVDHDPANRPTALELHYRLRRLRNESIEHGFV